MVKKEIINSKKRDFVQNHIFYAKKRDFLQKVRNAVHKLKGLMLITFSSPRAQPEVVYFLISNESPYYSNCKSKISASNSL